jgi:type IV secretion system protein TrbJ
MRRAIISAVAGSAATALLVFSLRPALALGPVYCTNCSTIVEQAVMAGKQLEQLAQEIQTAQNTLNFYMNAVQNTANLPFTVFNDITGTVSQITSIGQRAQMLINQTGTMIDNLGTGSAYPVATITDLQNQLATEQIAVSNAMTQAGNALNTLSGQLPANASNFSALHSQALGASDRQQSLQTLAGVAAAQGQVATQRQATSIAVEQAMLTAQTAQIDRNAANDALNKQDLANAVAADCAALALTGGSFWGCSAGAAPAATPAAAPATTTVAATTTSTVAMQ